MREHYDVIIIGGGPAGLTAALYAARARLNTLVLERLVIGGQVATTTLVENYPGFPEGIDGPEMMRLFEEQARRFGAEVEFDPALSLTLDGDRRIVTTEGGRALPSWTIILAMGSDPRRLNVPGEKEFANRGVSYCATCDGALFPEADVAVVGGGDSAAEEAQFLTRFAKKVYIIHRRDRLRAQKILQERLFANPKIEIIWDAVVQEIKGDEVLRHLMIKNLKDGSIRELPVEGLFVAIGHEPNSQLVKGLLELDPMGYIIANERMGTSLPGIFVAGDVRSGSTRQIATAVGDGSIAAMSAEKYLTEKGLA